MMSKNQKNIAIIPARGGSKGLPKKNIMPFNGKPLIAWTIEQALASQLVDEVLVSTDCETIASIAIDFGAIVPGLRPAELSSDTASTEDVLLHVCEELPQTIKEPENIILLQCTSPIRLPGTIDKAIEYMNLDDADSLLSVVKSHRFFWFNKEAPYASYDYKNRPRRQDVPDDKVAYMETGSIYITKFKKFLSIKNRILGKICMYETNFYESFEIDSIEDFEYCEYLARKVL